MNQITTIGLNKLKNIEKILILDVRNENELIEGYIKGSINLPLDNLEDKIYSLDLKKDEKIVIYCSKGIRSITASEILNKYGFKNLYSLSGGFNQWKEDNFDFARDEILTLDEVSRYSRQIKLKEIGKEGQLKLLNSKVLLIGAGGLGSPIALYLSSSGIGTIGIIDNDTVDLTNLHRQIIHNNDSVGKLKVESAKESINRINPNTNVIIFPKKLDKDNAKEIIKDFDLVIDGTDNFSSKYLINDICYELNKPYVYGSIFKFEGQVTLFDFKNKDHCYRCLFPSPPDSTLAPSCSEIGVLGVLPAIIGTLQAVEAIKYILNIGEILNKDLLVYDALDTYFRKIKIKKSSKCSLCNKIK